MAALEPFTRPVRKNPNGGFDVLLKPSITAAAVSETATPPDMLDEGSGAPAAGAQDWMSAVGEAAEAARTNGARAQYTPPASAMPPDMGGGPLSRMLPGGMGDTLAGVAGGFNTIDRNQSPLAGFAAGMTGAMTARETRRKDKRAEMMELEDRQWRQEDRLYQRTRDEKTDLREDRRFGILEKAEDRAVKAAQMDEVVTGLTAKKLNIELDRLANSSGLTNEQAVTLRGQITSSVKEQFEDSEMDDPDVQKAFLQAINDQYNDALQTITGRPAPGSSGAAATPLGSSIDSPLDWTPGSEPRTDAEFTAAAEAAVKANGGKPIIVRDPESKQLRLYRGAAAAM